MSWSDALYWCVKRVIFDVSVAKSMEKFVKGGRVW